MKLGCEDVKLLLVKKSKISNLNLRNIAPLA